MLPRFWRIYELSPVQRERFTDCSDLCLEPIP